VYKLFIIRKSLGNHSHYATLERDLNDSHIHLSFAERLHGRASIFGTQQTQMTDRNRTSATDYYVILQGDETLLLAALIFTEVDIIRFLTHELMHSYSGEGECIRDCNLQS
jgi:hypothetical protein